MGCFLSNPSRYRCVNASVSLMVLQAYGLKAYQLRPPASEDTVRFNVEANVPAGATTEQVRVMLQNLLTERFKLVFHREKIEVQGYVLLAAKGGPKMKDATSAPPRAPGTSPSTPATEAIKDADGFNNFHVRNGFTVSRANGLTRWVGTEVPMDSAEDANLCGILNSITGDPVVNATGLTGKYDLTLTFASDTAAGERQPASPAASGDDVGTVPLISGLTVFAALEKQLGLKLDSRKVMIEAFVIDHAEKTPVEN